MQDQPNYSLSLTQLSSESEHVQLWLLTVPERMFLLVVASVIVLQLASALAGNVTLATIQVSATDRVKDGLLYSQYRSEGLSDTSAA